MLDLDLKRCPIDERRGVIGIQRDYRNICYYETEVGPITLGVTGDGIACDLSEPAGGTAKFSYLLDADDPTALINRTTLEIQVEHIN